MSTCNNVKIVICMLGCIQCCQFCDLYKKVCQIEKKKEIKVVVRCICDVNNNNLLSIYWCRFGKSKKDVLATINEVIEFVQNKFQESFQFIIQFIESSFYSFRKHSESFRLYLFCPHCALLLSISEIKCDN